METIEAKGLLDNLEGRKKANKDFLAGGSTLYQHQDVCFEKCETLEREVAFADNVTIMGEVEYTQTRQGLRVKLVSTMIKLNYCAEQMRYCDTECLKRNYYEADFQRLHRSWAKSAKAFCDELTVTFREVDDFLASNNSFLKEDAFCDLLETRQAAELLMKGLPTLPDCSKERGLFLSVSEAFRTVTPMHEGTVESEEKTMDGQNKDGEVDMVDKDNVQLKNDDSEEGTLYEEGRKRQSCLSMLLDEYEDSIRLVIELESEVASLSEKKPTSRETSSHVIRKIHHASTEARAAIHGNTEENQKLRRENNCRNALKVKGRKAKPEEGSQIAVALQVGLGPDSNTNSPGIDAKGKAKELLQFAGKGQPPTYFGAK
ncbi:unnamed protein product [Caenorhabditis auriculariae]|uniref:Uncharacterized protein n=1 Tax=Caenorhabditis auriculariae TaxID=2777116 RepID=A0A8S1HCN8_9PELO|nr:unnamed protein product [Caenorhabditis auriculariae]